MANTKNSNNSKNNTKKMLQKTYKIRLAKHIFEENLQKYFPEVWNDIHSERAKSNRQLKFGKDAIDKPAISYRQFRAKNTGISGIKTVMMDDNKLCRIFVCLPYTPVTDEELFTKMIIRDVQLVGVSIKNQTGKAPKGLKQIVKDFPFLEDGEAIKEAAHNEYEKVIKNVNNRKADQFDRLYIYKSEDKLHTFYPANIPSELRFIQYCADNNIEYQTRLVKRFLRAEVRPNKFTENSWKIRDYESIEAIDNLVNKYIVKDETIKERCQKILKKNIEAHMKFEAAKKAELEAVLANAAKNTKTASAK